MAVKKTGIKTIQLPPEIWLLLKELADKDNRKIVDYTRLKIVELHQAEFADDIKKA